MLTKAEAALTYASWGWHVIPVVPNGKIPATQHGVKDATTDPEQLKALAKQLLQAWHTQKAATQWVNAQQL